MQNSQDISKHLSSEIKLSKNQILVFLLILEKGKMDITQISQKLKLPIGEALSTSKSLVNLGGFINISDTEFETMHPRFTLVNMYRNICMKYGIKFGRNKIIDNLGELLEDYYYKARTNN